MNTEMILTEPGYTEATTRPALERLQRVMWLSGLFLLIASLVLAGWFVRRHAPYTSDSNFAYNLGLVGGLLLLSLLLYPLRKRVKIMRHLGPLRHWLRFHLAVGVLGPMLVLFHSTFRVHSVNAAVALASMVLVVASGLVGLLLYRRVFRGLSGHRTTLGELQQSLRQQLERIESDHDLPEDIKRQIERFARLVSANPEGRWQRVAHFLSLGLRRRAAARRARLALKRYARPRSGSRDALKPLTDLLANIDATLKVAQSAAQFATYERLFSYWHAIHIPFLFLLFVTAVVHVIAVHAY